MWLARRRLTSSRPTRAAIEAAATAAARVGSSRQGDRQKYNEEQKAEITNVCTDNTGSRVVQ
jgi:hypothetical protein